MLSFFLIGINEADLFNCTEYGNGRLTYMRTKVARRRRDRGKISVRIEPEAKELFEKYRDSSGSRVFNFYRKHATLESFRVSINGSHRNWAGVNKYTTGLKRVGEDIGVDGLQYYAARHTWATIAQNEAGVDKYTVHIALNHVIQEMKVTDIYTKKDWSLIDAANRKVIDYVLGKQGI